MWFRKERPQQQQPAPEPEKPTEETLDPGLQVHAAVAEAVDGARRMNLQTARSYSRARLDFGISFGEGFDITVNSPTITVRAVNMVQNKENGLL